MRWRILTKEAYKLEKFDYNRIAGSKKPSFSDLCATSYT